MLIQKSELSDWKVSPLHHSYAIVEYLLWKVHVRNRCSDSSLEFLHDAPNLYKTINFIWDPVVVFKLGVTCREYFRCNYLTYDLTDKNTMCLWYPCDWGKVAMVQHEFLFFQSPSCGCCRMHRPSAARHYVFLALYN